MLKAVLVGCGRMGAEPSVRLTGKIPPGWLPISHAEAMLACPAIELNGLSDVDSARLAWAAAHYQINQTATDYAQLISTIRPSVVSIATRTPDKSAIITCAIHHGVKGIYVEKPLANNLSAVDNILALAKKHDVHVAYGVNRRYHALYRQARAMLLSGDLGELREIIIEFGESALFWTHPHTMDLILFFSGESPNAIQAHLDSRSVTQKNDLHIESDPIITHAHMWFANGTRATITRGNGCHIKLACSRGSIEIPNDGTALHVRKETAPGGYFNHESTLAATEQTSATVTAFHELAQAILNNQPLTTITPQDIRNGMALLFGAAFSGIKNGEKINIHDVPPTLTVMATTNGRYA
jgi:scyllo-inositol 2-dehydrogenase (NAD+)